MLAPEAVLPFNKACAAFFITKATNETESKLKIFCMEKAISFLHATEHLERMAHWILQESESPLKLTQEQKHVVLKQYFACPDFTTEQKQSLKEAVMKDDNTDNGKIVAKSCDLLVPDKAMKETLWT